MRAADEGRSDLGPKGALQQAHFTIAVMRRDAAVACGGGARGAACTLTLYPGPAADQRPLRVLGRAGPGRGRRRVPGGRRGPRRAQPVPPAQRARAQRRRARRALLRVHPPGRPPVAKVRRRQGAGCAGLPSARGRCRAGQLACRKRRARAAGYCSHGGSRDAARLRAGPGHAWVDRLAQR